ncbi:hypothetical protein AJ79_07005 [Helicocarpus griseus UAMH5409]|uniref:Uncharacterized protein n=1 Tax=Helicocarpus griseus UAMH5409 TaxID=1447875 RepID=A0A2B7X6N1_9EURO|nr:hypothetical protein AJ79_07005 [Helicocarpus griseus UAMH5409]
MDGGASVSKVVEIYGKHYVTLFFPVWLNGVDFEYTPWVKQFYGQSSHVLIFIYDATSRQVFDRIASSCETIFRHVYGTEFPKHESNKFALAARPTKYVWPKSRRTFTCFPLLPHELQLAVLQECLTCTGSVILPDPNFSGINLNVLLVCKLFYQEGVKIFWEHNSFASFQPITFIADTTFVSPDRPRVVSTEEGEELARRSLQCKYIEISARDEHDYFSETVMDACRLYIARKGIPRGRQVSGSSNLPYGLNRREIHRGCNHISCNWPEIKSYLRATGHRILTKILARTYSRKWQRKWVGKNRTVRA